MTLTELLLELSGTQFVLDSASGTWALRGVYMCFSPLLTKQASPYILLPKLAMKHSHTNLKHFPYLPEVPYWLVSHAEPFQSGLTNAELPNAPILA